MKLKPHPEASAPTLSLPLTSQRVALIDCNNFYVSCERVFNPALRDKGVVVLSNNDGCVISRSAEAKAAGVKMGALYHEVRRFLEVCQITALSSNYPLYGDMSFRVMETISTFSSGVEVYSIDEAFADLSHVPDHQLPDYGAEILQRVMEWTGIPVSIGIAPTKTLAKTAASRAKKIRGGPRVFCAFTPEGITDLLASTPVEDLWGIGRAHSARLRSHGVESALKLAGLPDRWIDGILGITGLAVARELRAIPCHILEKAPPARKGISCTRTFPHGLECHDTISMAISSFAARVGEKLRERSLLAGTMTLYLSTGPFAEERSSLCRTVSFPCATQDTMLITRRALKLLKSIYKSGLNR